MSIETIGLKFHGVLEFLRSTLRSILPSGNVFGIMDWVSVVFLIVSVGIIFVIQKYGEGRIKLSMIWWTIILFMLLRFG